MKEELKEIIVRLNKIAKLNNDQFNYRILVHPVKINFTFEAFETVDRHIFVSGYGETINEALNEAMKDIPNACLHWGYKDI